MQAKSEHDGWAALAEGLAAAMVMPSDEAPTNGRASRDREARRAAIYCDATPTGDADRRRRRTARRGGGTLVWPPNGRETPLNGALYGVVWTRSGVDPRWSRPATQKHVRPRWSSVRGRDPSQMFSKSAGVDGRRRRLSWQIPFQQSRLSRYPTAVFQRARWL